LATREVITTRAFDRTFRRLSKSVRSSTYDKLQRYLEDPGHPSLRVKRMQGTARIWEMSVTMNYRITFELTDDKMILRRIGTHDVLRKP
jgi:mRNA-degrading endonuclease YafQ of YafQ-DinJ toxin-antitoxin module